MSEETSSNPGPSRSKKHPILLGIIVALLLVVGVESYFLLTQKESKEFPFREAGEQESIHQQEEDSFPKNPFQENEFLAEMKALQRRIDRMFEQHFEDSFGSPFPHFREEVSWYDFDIDLHETDSSFIVSCDIPGLDKNEINVELEGNVLTIEGERSETNEDLNEQDGWVSRERHFGSFSRSIALPAPVDPKSVKAEYKKGVLRITVDKLQPDQPQRTRIQVI